MNSTRMSARDWISSVWSAVDASCVRCQYVASCNEATQLRALSPWITISRRPIAFSLVLFHSVLALPFSDDNDWYAFLPASCQAGQMLGADQKKFCGLS